jgi:cell division protein FtsX
MKRTLMTVLVVLTLCVVVVGFYRGWFSLSSHSGDAGSNKVQMNLTVDPDKVKEDAGKVKDKTTELTGK